MKNLLPASALTPGSIHTSIWVKAFHIQSGVLTKTDSCSAKAADLYSVAFPFRVWCYFSEWDIDPVTSTIYEGRNQWAACGLAQKPQTGANAGISAV